MSARQEPAANHRKALGRAAIQIPGPAAPPPADLPSPWPTPRLLFAEDIHRDVFGADKRVKHDWIRRNVAPGLWSKVGRYWAVWSWHVEAWMAAARRGGAP